MTEGPASEVQVVLVTAPDLAAGQRLAHALVEEHRAACVNVLPGVHSVYRWEGAIEEAGEVLLLIKTTAAGFERLRARVLELHPYDTPEILALPVVAGEGGYLEWVRSGVGGDR